MKKLLFLMAFLATAATEAQTTNEPKTIFEAHNHLADTPLFRGMSIVPGTDASFLEVRAEQLINLTRSNSVFAVSLRGRAANYTDVDYIDYDELDGLIRGLQLISQAGHSSTTMDDFEALYRTRSGFSVIKSSAGNNVTIIIKSGRDDSQRVQVENYFLNDLAQSLSAAKAKLDAMH